ncbi:hypothetical protein VTI74DRAFT_4424 [Chaetomium olivicolor]
MAKTGETWSSAKVRTCRYGLWTGFLSFFASIGADLTVEHATASEQAYRFESPATIKSSSSVSNVVEDRVDGDGNLVGGGVPVSLGSELGMSRTALKSG